MVLDMKTYKYNYRNRTMNINIKISNLDLYYVEDKFKKCKKRDKDIPNIQYIARG